MKNLLYKVSGKNDIPVEVKDRIDDIPTHIAISNTKKFDTHQGSLKSKNKKVTFTMVHNPSHLESQNAISMGKTKAKIDDIENGDTPDNNGTNWIVDGEGGGQAPREVYIAVITITPTSGSGNIKYDIDAVDSISGNTFSIVSR